MLKLTLIMIAIAVMFLMVAMTIDGILIGDSQELKRRKTFPCGREFSHLKFG